MTASKQFHHSDCEDPLTSRRTSDDRRPRVVIVGGGFAGLAAATALRRAPVRVTLIDRRNHHLFQPLLYQVATAALSPNQIASPIRTILRGQKNAAVMMDDVTGIDRDRREVQAGDRRVPYDYLIVATGARQSYFGRDDWAPLAPGLKSLEDAIELRKRILLAFERAEFEGDPDERRRLLTFVVIGGGPTGVETAGAIAELARKALAMDFRSIDPSCARIVLVEAGPRLLSVFPERLARHASHALDALGVEALVGRKITQIVDGGVTLGDEFIATRSVVWAAGVASSPAAAWTGCETDGAGRALVRRDLTAPGHSEIFVLGDCAHAANDSGAPLPGLAPVAKQQGIYAAHVISNELKGRRSRKPFRYKPVGTMATIGRHSAIADFGHVRLVGFVGWLTWSAAHIYFLIGFRNRVAVAFDWAWSYLTFERGARLITGPIAPTRPTSQTPSTRRAA